MICISPLARKSQFGRIQPSLYIVPGRSHASMCSQLELISTRKKIPLHTTTTLHTYTNLPRPVYITLFLRPESEWTEIPKSTSTHRQLLIAPQAPQTSRHCSSRHCEPLAPAKPSRLQIPYNQKIMTPRRVSSIWPVPNHQREQESRFHQ